MRDDPHELIREELEGLPLRYTFDSGSKNPFVTIVNEQLNDHRKIVFSRMPKGQDLANIRSDVRRAIRALGCHPQGALGKKIAETIKAKDIKMPPPSQPQTKPPANANTDYIHKFAQQVAEPKPRVVPDARQTAVAPVTQKPIEETKAEIKRANFNHGEVALLTKTLMKHAATDEATHRLTYHDGWDDTRVLKLLTAVPGREHLTIKSLANFRKDTFGLLESEAEAAAEAASAGKGGIPILWNAIKEINRRLDLLEATDPRK